MNKKLLSGNQSKFAKLMILLAWEAGELSEAQAVAALQMQTVDVREMRANVIKTGVKLHEILTRK